MGFVEEGGELYCQRDYEQYLAPPCGKCGQKIVGVCNKQQRMHVGLCYLYKMHYFFMNHIMLNHLVRLALFFGYYNILMYTLIDYLVLLLNALLQIKDILFQHTFVIL